LCPQCRKHFTVGSGWQAAFAGFLLFAFVLSAMLSIKLRGFAPYLIILIALCVAAAFVFQFAKPRVVVPSSPWLSALHYAVFVLFLFALVHFLGNESA
jgi:hypothetical protein